MFSFFLFLSCSKSEPWTPLKGSQSPDDSNSTEAESEPSSEISEEDFEIGDPISFEASWPLTPRGDGEGVMREWIDASIYDEQYAILAGVSGVSIVSRENGEIIQDSSSINLVYRIDTDGELIVVGSRTNEISFLEISNTELTVVHQVEAEGTHEDVAVDDGVVAITWRQDGLKLYQDDGQLITTISAEDAFTVDIFEDTLVYSDLETLVLLDISNPESPQELDRIEMPAEGRDLSWNGKFAAVGLGGNGVATYKVENNRFIAHDEFLFDGSALSVALDGEYLWTATWNSVWISWLSDTKAYHLGQETPQYSAMGLDAKGGRAIIADWLNSSVMHHNTGVWGAEVSLPKDMYFSQDEPETIPLPVSNYSSQDLIVDFSPPSEISMNVESVTVEPGKTEYVRITTPSPPWINIQIPWSSNDPDEASSQIRLLTSSAAIGAEHVDFNLQLVTEEGVSGSASLSDYEGKILFLAWWADF